MITCGKDLDYMKSVISIGNQDFVSIRKNNCFYIDKTDFIREWWENQDSVTLITRPRRFGKTLNMSMTEYFFSVNHVDSRKYFEELNIWSYEKFRELQGSYPVISLSFADIKATTYESARRAIIRKLVRMYSQFEFLRNSEQLNEKDRAYFDSVEETMSDDAASGGTSPYYGLTIASTLAWGLGYFGMPHILLRFMGIEDENKLKTSRRIASVWVVISMFIAIFIGIIGNAMTKAGAMDVLENSSQSETLIVRTAVLLSNHGFLAVLMAGLILAGILASTMSTSDSQLLAASSSISENLLQDCFGIKCTKKQSMLMARITVLVIAAISVFLARNPDSSVFRIVSFAWAGFGATFGAVMLFALFWKRSNRNGALAGMIVGGAMVFIWKFLIAPHGGLLGIYELLPAFLCSAAAIVIVSLLTAPPSQEIVDEFESV